MPPQRMRLRGRVLLLLLYLLLLLLYLLLLLLLLHLLLVLWPAWRRLQLRRIVAAADADAAAGSCSRYQSACGALDQPGIGTSCPQGTEKRRREHRRSCARLGAWGSSKLHVQRMPTTLRVMECSLMSVITERKGAERGWVRLGMGGRTRAGAKPVRRSQEALFARPLRRLHTRPFCCSEPPSSSPPGEHSACDKQHPCYRFSTNLRACRCAMLVVTLCAAATMHLHAARRLGVLRYWLTRCSERDDWVEVHMRQGT